MLSAGAEEILRKRSFAHVAVAVGDGPPHVTPVWVDVADGKVVVNTALGRVKDRLLQVGAPVALSATDPDNAYSWVMVRGRVAERRTEGADAVIDSLAKKYLDADTYPFRQPGEQRVTIVIEPDDVLTSA